MSLLDGVKVLYHSSIRIEKAGIIVYCDPYEIEGNPHDADFILITHEHYDHFSIDDVKKIMNDDTIIISVPNVIYAVKEVQPNEEKLVAVKPNESYDFNNVLIETVAAYNRLKPFHQKQKGWVGYIVQIDGIRIYIAGDTDDLDELKTIKCDVAMVPVGGTYTMNYKEAADLVNLIHPQCAIPTHYGSVVGTIEDAIKFENLVDNSIETKRFI